MKPFSIEPLPDYPAISITILSDFQSREHLLLLLEEMKQVLDACVEPVYIVAELYETQTTFDDLMYATNEAARGAGKAVLHHPKLKLTLVTTKHKLWAIAAKGMSSEAFGKVPVRVFDSRELALAYIREQG
jgi:hypothetical protein